MIGIFAASWLAIAPMSHGECLSTVQNDPEAALNYAEKWESLGGADEARHCRALAYIALDGPGRGARLLSLLAKSSRAEEGVVTRLHIQAAEAYMLAGDHSQSYAALRDAYALVPDSPDLHMAAATIYATGKQWEGTVLALTALERFAPLSSDALVLRGNAHFERLDYAEAAMDVTAALELEPHLIDALVLRGKLLSEGVQLSADPVQ